MDRPATVRPHRIAAQPGPVISPIKRCHGRGYCRKGRLIVTGLACLGSGLGRVGGQKRLLPRSTGPNARCAGPSQSSARPGAVKRRLLRKILFSGPMRAMVRRRFGQRSLSLRVEQRPASRTSHPNFRDRAGAARSMQSGAKWSSLHRSTAPFHRAFRHGLGHLLKQLYPASRENGKHQPDSCGPRYAERFWPPPSVWIAAIPGRELLLQSIITTRR